MNELAGQSLGGYLLEEEIGHGSMGVVYRGKQIALGREVAIKVLPKTLARDSSYIARFIREAQIIAGLNHPNIVHIYDAGQQNKLLYYVMEYVQGPTFASLLSLDGTIPPRLAIEYGAQIADALDVAYKEHHVIHRDVKPENLMLDRWGKVKVMDFGLARAMGYQPITMARTLVGSLYYASPEQVWGHQLDNRSDVYALGVVLYEMATGQRPFNGRTMPELTQAIINGPLRAPTTFDTEVSPGLEQIILTAMARNREQRFEDAGMMARELRFLQEKSKSTTPPSQTTSELALRQLQRSQYQLQPPKRPQAQRPLYENIIISPPSNEKKATGQATSSDTPALQNIPDRPTKPLVVSPSPSTPYIASQTTVKTASQPAGKTKKPIWRKIQQLFKDNID